MKIFSYLSYRKFLQDKMSSQKKERGIAARISEATGIHSSILSQVIQGHRDLTNEQTVAIADYLEFDDEETSYLLLLVQLERAGTARLREVLSKQTEAIRARADAVERRIPKSASLTLEQKATFYSAWYFSAARILTSIPAYQQIEALRSKLTLSNILFKKIVNFLISSGLVSEANGKLSIGILSTHISANSPLVNQHHANWRIKALEKHPILKPESELAFTSPLTLSKNDALKVREMVLHLIEEVCVIADPSKPEVAYCMNIDWFEI